MKKIVAYLFLPGLLIIGSTAFSQTVEKPNQKENVIVSESEQEILTMEKAIKDHGYPIQKNSGNADADYLEYKKAKDQWIANNPEIYKQMTQRNSREPSPVKFSEKKESRKQQ